MVPEGGTATVKMREGNSGCPAMSLGVHPAKSTRTALTPPADMGVSCAVGMRTSNRVPAAELSSNRAGSFTEAAMDTPAPSANAKAAHESERNHFIWRAPGIRTSRLRLRA